MVVVPENFSVYSSATVTNVSAARVLFGSSSIVLTLDRTNLFNRGKGVAHLLGVLTLPYAYCACCGTAPVCMYAQFFLDKAIAHHHPIQHAAAYPPPTNDKPHLLVSAPPAYRIAPCPGRTPPRSCMTARERQKAKAVDIRRCSYKSELLWCCYPQRGEFASRSQNQLLSQRWVSSALLSCRSPL